MSRPRVLVMGGTRYFGKILVNSLLEEGAKVTLLNRGIAADPFGDQVERLRADREKEPEMMAALRGRDWDAVFDQICYTSSDAAIACKVFENHVGRFIHTSTQSVYPGHGRVTEADYDPSRHEIRMGTRADFSYPEGKRQAEAFYFQRAAFPVAALRIPIVFGFEDYTRRLAFHVERVRAGTPILIPDLQAEACFIEARDAAKALSWLAKQRDFVGPLNACSSQPIRMGELMNTIAEIVGRAPVIIDQGEEADHTPVSDGQSRSMSPARAESMGLICDPISSWLPGLIRAI